MQNSCSELLKVRRKVRDNNPVNLPCMVHAWDSLVDDRHHRASDAGHQPMVGHACFTIGQLCRSCRSCARLKPRL